MEKVEPGIPPELLDLVEAILPLYIKSGDTKFIQQGTAIALDTLQYLQMFKSSDLAEWFEEEIRELGILNKDTQTPPPSPFNRLKRFINELY